MGYGNGSYWAWIGKSFYVSGSGSRSANIRMAGHFNGTTLGVLAAAGATDIKLVVKDATTGTSYNTTIYSASGTNMPGQIANQDFNNGVSVTLMSGHSYKAYVEIDGSASITGMGIGASIFGPWGGDANNQVSYSSLTIDF